MTPMDTLYADENFPRAVVEELRRLGHDVLTALQAGQANQRIPDPDVLAFAMSLGRAVLTLNRRHFARLHVQTPSHCGIVVSTPDAGAAALAQRIHLAIVAERPLHGKLLRIVKQDNFINKSLEGGLHGTCGSTLVRRGVGTAAG